MFQNKINELVSIHSSHEGKVSDKWESYLRQYDRILRPYRDESIDLLEIGVQNGGSLDVWATYFPKARKIIGCDINPKCGLLAFEDERISVIIGDATDKAVIEQVSSMIETPEVIIDDGSHFSSEIVKTFASYFPILASDGVYVVEDLHCSYWREYEGGLFHPYSSMAFLKALADVLNYQHWGLDAPPMKVLREFFDKYGIELTEETLAQIHSIEFVNSLCIIKKREPAQNVIGKQTVVGTEEQVLPGRLLLKGTESVPSPDQSQNPWQTSLIEQIDTLSQAVAERDVQLSELALKESDLRNELSHLEQNEAELTKQIDTLSQAVAERDVQLSELALKERGLECKVIEYKHNIEYVSSKLNSILNSHSWKVTKPLRQIKIMVVRVKNFLNIKWWLK